MDNNKGSAGHRAQSDMMVDRKATDKTPYSKEGGNRRRPLRSRPPMGIFRTFKGDSKPSNGVDKRRDRTTGKPSRRISSRKAYPPFALFNLYPEKVQLPSIREIFNLIPEAERPAHMQESESLSWFCPFDLY